MTRHALKPVDTPFQIKICGVKTISDARLVEQSGADAVGLNFYAPSPRSVSLEQAKRLRSCFSQKTSVVGLFVNASAKNVNEIAQQLQLDYIQLHGDESPEYLSQIFAAPVIRALRCGREASVDPTLEVDHAVQYVNRCLEQQVGLHALLLDAYVQGRYGGAGKRLDGPTFTEIARQVGVPVILAGGLTPENVAAAIASTDARAVDTASGVEKAPGEKDGARVAQFVAHARLAWKKTAK